MTRYTLTDKVCIITGANSGIGKAAAIQFAQAGGTVIMACRSAERGQAALEDIRKTSGSDRVEMMLVDMASQASIRAFAADFIAQYDRLHVLVHNAANFDPKLKASVLTEDGIELIFATNHIGPFLLTHLLLDTMKNSAPARIINISSKGLMMHPFMTIDFDDLNMQQRRYTYSRAYYHSKLAHMMFTYDLARRLKDTQVTVNAIRVTNVRVDIDRYPDMPQFLKRIYGIKQRFSLTPEAMAETYLHLAAAPELEGVTGSYFDENNKQVKSSKPSYDEQSWNRLWTVSEQLAGLSE